MASPPTKATSNSGISGQSTPQPQRKVCIVGGGPVGTLAALYFAKENWDVEVYELRPGALNRATLASSQVTEGQTDG